jgi:hypothetical protein
VFHVNNHKQGHIVDPWAQIGPKRKKRLEGSWAELFQQEILLKLPVESLRKHYHDWNGRPTKELYSMIGLMVLQQMHDLTDAQAMEQFCFNIKWHYALNITNPSDAASYVSPKTLWSMREILSTEEAYTEIFDTTLQTLTALFKTHLEKQRMDSVHIKSNMRHLGRIGLFVKTIKKFLRNLKRHHCNLFDSLDGTLTRRYLCKKEESIFAMVKPSESAHTLDQLAKDVFTLTHRFASVPRVNDMSSFKLLVRLFKEQCVHDDNDGSSEKKAVAKPNKDVPSDSLQNPSDPDAGYSSHKGQGYQVQVVENYSEGDAKQLSLFTHVDVQSADQHDANALLPALDDLQKRGMAPDKMLADSLYGGDTNCEQARKEYDVEVIAPAMPGNQKKMHLADFTIDDQGRIVSCPKGIVPDKVKQNKKTYSAAFPITSCRNCKIFKQCPVTQGKKAFYYRYKEKDVRLARRRLNENTAAFKDTYRYRAGIEAAMSEFDRLTGVKHLRVRGMKAVCFAVVMKAIGLNILRAGRFRNRKSGPSEPQCGTIESFLVVCVLIKEQFKRRTKKFATMLIKFQPKFLNRPKLAF